MVRPRCSLFFSKRVRFPCLLLLSPTFRFGCDFYSIFFVRIYLPLPHSRKEYFKFAFPLLSSELSSIPPHFRHVASSLFSSKSLTVWFRLPFSESSVRHTILSVQFVCLFSGPLEKSDLLTYCTCTFGLFFSWEWKWKSLVNSIDASRRTIYENFTWQVSA